MNTVSSFGNRISNKDIVELEVELPRRATKIIKSMDCLPYEERPQRLGLCSLEKRQVREGYGRRLYKGVGKVISEALFILSHKTKIRGHMIK